MNLITSMRTEALNNSNYGTTNYICWELLEDSDTVIEVIATTAEIIYTADNGSDYLETTDLNEYMAEIGHLLQ